MHVSYLKKPLVCCMWRRCRLLGVALIQDFPAVMHLLVKVLCGGILPFARAVGLRCSFL